MIHSYEVLCGLTLSQVVDLCLDARKYREDSVWLTGCFRKEKSLSRVLGSCGDSGRDAYDMHLVNISMQ